MAFQALTGYPGRYLLRQSIQSTLRRTDKGERWLVALWDFRNCDDSIRDTARLLLVHETYGVSLDVHSEPSSKEV